MLQPEIAERNMRIARNDQFIYGDKLKKSLNIPLGHDLTEVNWLRRAVEIHRSQFMGRGFAVDSSYQALDPQNAADDQDKQRIQIENEKAKGFAAMRREIIESIIRDNDADSFWASAAENASAVGDTVIKGWYDEEKGKYCLEIVESIENFYSLWNKDNYRHHDAVGYIYQITKQNAIDWYGVSQDVQLSPLGSPLSVLVAGQVFQYMSMQPMVTIMEITGKIEGWASKNGRLYRVNPGKETKVNAIIVGDTLYQLIDSPKYMPHYYILPNKHARRRPWGLPDISEAAIQINLTYIEALSDWRTVASKVNFPKFKGIGFAPGVQPPKPRSRTVEVLPLADGQDIQPISMSQSAELAAPDFRNQLSEMENQFVREVGISRQLFDMPDGPDNSNPAAITAMRSISDITAAKRALWEPILTKMFNDALETLAYWDDSIRQVVRDSNPWHVKISWPSNLNADDPTYQTMKLNQFNTGILSLQTLLEEIGYDKQELDRIREEMNDPVLASIHGHMLGALAQALLTPQGPADPKVSINLRGDLSPEQEANLAYSRGFNNGPFGPTAAPQGNAGLTAEDNLMNQGYITGKQNSGGMPVNNTPQSAPQGAPLIQSNGQSGSQGIMSQPGSGAAPVTPQGSINQQTQQQGG